MALQSSNLRAFLCVVAHGGDHPLETRRRGGLCLRPWCSPLLASNKRALLPAAAPIAAHPFSVATTTICSSMLRTCAKWDGVHHPRKEDDGYHHEQGDGGGEPFDEWMRECVVEIVRNIGEAPFLVHVFSSGTKGGAATVRLQREVADAESWPGIRSRWDRGMTTPPDGLILVEELLTQGQTGIISRSSSSSGSKTWGLVVQGWGAADSAACYILRTCRVASASGSCTHFCLVRARCCGDTADVQLMKAWLVGSSV